MNKTLVEKIQANPNYIELVSKRSGFALRLAIFVLAMFYSYILVIAFNRELLGVKLSETAVEGSKWIFDKTVGENGAYVLSSTTEMLAPVMTWAFPVAAGVILIGFLSTLIYVLRANGEFEDLTNAVKEDVKDDL